MSAANIVDVNGIKSIAEFSYGSLLDPPSKIFACHYTFLALIMAFLPKIWVLEWPSFLKIGLGGLNLKK